VISEPSPECLRLLDHARGILKGKTRIVRGAQIICFEEEWAFSPDGIVLASTGQMSLLTELGV
jgi:hypothetical protein